ncbi:uncharacterized protein LOC113279455 [Papaver somniferum]|uniref:uncharacterized protein LOC113279455 n=1 Tax=Papaver somniferum TaxID=3469 RepID=UPI000E6FE2CC|nr:uncharacterized protein LOC113279455 [Papaver somniferum]
MSGASAAIADDLLQSITGVVNLWLAGKCPPILGEIVASAPLTPLLKPGGGLRPIAVGTICRRLCSKLAANSFCKDLDSYLGNCQYGIGIPCGGEGILHSANRLLDLHGSDNTKSMLLIDFSNAFNLVDRSTIIREVRAHCPSISHWVEFCYMKPARLYYRDHILSSTQGMQHGDPLGPLLFALALHPLVEKIATNCTLDFHAWYLDDDTIAGDTMEVSKALKILQDDGPGYGLHLNISKTKLFWPSYDLRRDADNAFPANIGKPKDGVKLLGGPVSLDTNFCSNIVMHRVDKTIRLMDKIQELHDPQCELLLLRSCTGVSRLYFSLRTTCPKALQTVADRFDDYLMQYLRRLVVGDGAGFGLVQQRLSTLPIKDGGIGILTMSDTMKYCYLASQAQTQHLQNSILKLPITADLCPGFHSVLQGFTQACGISSPDFNIKDTAPQYMKSLEAIYFGAVREKVPSSFSLSSCEATVWQCNRAYHAMDFLKAIPIPCLNQAVGPRKFSYVLQYRLAIRLFEEDNKCSCCGKIMDIFGDHAIHFASEVGLTFRHDLVKDILADMCYRAGVVARKEVSLSSTTRIFDQRISWFIIRKMVEMFVLMSQESLHSLMLELATSYQVMPFLQISPARTINTWMLALHSVMVLVCWPFPLLVSLVRIF